MLSNSKVQRKEKLDRWAQGKQPPKDKKAIRARNNAKSNVGEYRT